MTPKTIKGIITTYLFRKTVDNLPFFLCFLTGLFLVPKASGQDIASPRFFEFNVQPTAANSISNTPQFQPGVVPQTQPSYLMQAALKFPLKLNGNTRIIGELKHKKEFASGYYTLDDNHFEQIELRQSRGSIILLSQLDENWKFTNVLSVSSNSTHFISTNANAMQFRNISMFEKALKNGSTIGFGGTVTYDQNLTLIPIFRYATDFGSNWKLDMILPKEIEVSKNLNQRSRLLLNIQGSGLNYNLGDELVANDLTSSSVYKRLDLSGSIGYERQVTPWVGFSVQAGAMMPISAGIYANDSSQTQLYQFNSGVSPYFKAGVFLSSPK